MHQVCHGRSQPPHPQFQTVKFAAQLYASRRATPDRPVTRSLLVSLESPIPCNRLRLTRLRDLSAPAGVTGGMGSCRRPPLGWVGFGGSIHSAQIGACHGTCSRRLSSGSRHLPRQAPWLVLLRVLGHGLTRLRLLLRAIRHASCTRVMPLAIGWCWERRATGLPWQLSRRPLG